MFHVKHLLLLYKNVSRGTLWCKTIEKQILLCLYMSRILHKPSTLFYYLYPDIKNLLLLYFLTQQLNPRNNIYIELNLIKYNFIDKHDFFLDSINRITELFIDLLIESFVYSWITNKSHSRFLNNEKIWFIHIKKF